MRWMIPLLAVAYLAGCDEEADPIRSSGPDDVLPNQAAAFAARRSADGGVGINAFLPVPLDDTANTTGVQPAYTLTQIGSSPLMRLRIGNPSSTSSLLNINNSGGGNGIFLVSSGTGTGMFISQQNSNASSAALSLSNNGSGTLISGSLGDDVIGLNLLATTAANSSMIQVSNFGTGFMGQFTGNSSTSQGVIMTTRGPRVLELFNNSTTSNTSAMLVTKNGPGLAADFSKSASGFVAQFRNTNASGNGVRISTVAGTMGLQVVGGSKNAVVGTSTGARALHAEEATEVWFTDYGFARLQNGRAVVTIDPTFLETVRLDLPYHVFVQAYGPAELYVSRRSAGSFEVRARPGAADTDFSFRIVGKRRGFEDQRLNRAPWADHDPNLR
jgi:hypothetical protein